MQVLSADCKQRKLPHELFIFTAAFSLLYKAKLLYIC